MWPPELSGTIFRLRPRVERMEDRTLLSTFVVSDTADSGPGSFRQAILDSNAATGQTNTIDFDIPGQGVQTIAPLSALPAITNPVLVDGFSQPGYSNAPLIQIDGSRAGTADGLSITGSDVTVRGLAISNFSQGAGILISGIGASGDVIASSDIGTDPTGTQALPNYFGVQILAGAHDNLVGGATAAAGNLITDNLGPGVTVEGDASVGNQVTANRIFANDVSPTPQPSEMLQFDGSSYVRLPGGLVSGATAPNQGSDRTIEAWFQTTSGGVILGYQNSDPSANQASGAPLLYIGSDGKLYGTLSGASPISSGVPVDDGRWHDVALVNNYFHETTLYLDGQLVGSGSSGSWLAPGSSFYQIGTGYTNSSDPAAPGGWYGFRGQIADVAIWTVARSAGEIPQDMTTAPTGSVPDLRAYYPFDEGGGLTAHDLSLNHDDATLAGVNGHLPTWSSSVGLAIDLGDDGVTDNSTTPRLGPNDFQNFPITLATAGGPLEGWLLGSEPGTTYRIDLFASASYAPGGAGEAQDFLGSLQVTTDNHGQAVFDVPFTAPAGLPLVTATATDPYGNTSEVSAARAASLEAPAQAVRVVPGQPLIFSAGSGDAIAIQDPDAGPLDAAWDLTLSVPAGLLTLASTAGLAGSGDGTGTLHYQASLPVLDSALAGLSFTPPPGFYGNISLNLDAESAGALPLQTRFVITTGRFLVTTTADSGAGSLRHALLDSNAAPGGTNTIDFAIAGSGVQTIALVSPLPAITSPVVINGTSQPSYAGAPLIALDTASSGVADGLSLDDSAVTVRGLANGGFALGGRSLPDDLTLLSGPLPVSDGGIGGRVDTYRIDTATDGRLLVQFESPGVTARLSLLDAQGHMLVNSDGLSPANPDGQIDQHLAAGSYILVFATTGGAGDLALTAMFTPASPPFQPINVNPANSLNVGNDPLAVGDFNGDGISDLVAEDGVHLGLGSGAFQDPVAGLGLSAGNPSLDGIVTGDFAGNGKLDLAVAITFSSDIAVLLGNGDGTFQAPTYYAVGSRGYLLGAGTILVAGDFAGNGHLDLAVANYRSNDVSVLLGNGDGTFQPAVDYPVGQYPDAIVAGDFNRDGHLDLAVACYGNEDPPPQSPAGTDPGGVYLLLGNGDGTFQPAKEYAAAQGPVALVAGDIRGDGKLDLAVACGNPFYVSGEVSLLLGNGDGTFQAPQTVFTGDPTALVAGDFRGDGRLDLAVANSILGTVSVLLGNGDGTFQAPQTYNPGVSTPLSLVAGDFTGNGRLDLATADGYSDQISVLLNNGDGTFQVQDQGQENFATGVGPGGPAVGDFTGSGRLDVATANYYSNDISVLLGKGDGTFQPQERFAAGISPNVIVAGDFNGDGRLDLAEAGPDLSTGAGAISVLLGNGDGTFQSPQEYVIGAGLFLTSLVAGDFTGDGRLDLAALGYNLSTGAGEVSVLLGDGNGTFQPAGEYPTGWWPSAIVAGDFTGDGRLDLAVDALTAKYSTAGEVSVLLSNGDGTFQPAVPYAAGYSSGTNPIVAGDFTGNGRLDIVTANGSGTTLSMLLGNGDGTFQPAKDWAVGLPNPFDLLSGDFNGDGHLDLFVAYDNPETGLGQFSVLLGNGDGAFQLGQTIIPPSQGMLALEAGDFTGDGRLDIAIANSNTNTVSVLVNNGDGTFTPTGQLATTPQANPVVADVTGDGTEDMLVVDGSGSILYRQGIPGQPGTFEPPITINPGFPSRDIAPVTTGGAPLIASVDARDDSVSLYAWRGGAFLRIGLLAAGLLPAQIIAADLDGSGSDDLVVRNAGDRTLSIFFAQTFTGPADSQIDFQAFRAPVTLPVGTGVSDVQAIDTMGSGRLDLVVTNKLTGQVSVFHNLGNGSFAAPVPYRAGTGLSAIDPSSTPEVTSQEATAGVAAGPLTPGGPNDLVTINPGSETLDALANLGRGRFANPTTIGTETTGAIVRMADFTGNGTDDLAVLSSNGLSIYLGNGKGRFLPPTTYAVPPEADGLTVAHLLGNGKLDLLVGDAYGDVLVLIGNGNGTFQPYHEANQTIELAVADLTGNGAKDIIYADQGLDRVVVDYGAGNSSVLANQSTGLLEPGAVQLAYLAGPDYPPDLIVANSGSNNVLIYPGLGNGQFGPAINDGNGYFVGTNPVGITVANLTGALPDLVVADKGSNEVSILLNTSQGGKISFSAGPRLNADGIGPVSTVVGNFTGGPYPDLLVTNSGSNNVTLLPGVGQGFFNDQNPTVYSVGTDPVASFVGNFNGTTDLVTVNAGSNDLTLISGFEGTSPVTTTIASGGVDPTTAFAFASGSSFEDLVVGNGGNGVLALFEGGKDGLSLASTTTEPQLPSPTAMVFAGLAGGAVQFYAATEGQEAAALVALSLGGDIASGTALIAAPTVAVAQLVPLQESSLALAGTLIIVALESPIGAVETEAVAATALSVSSGVPLTAGQSVPGQGLGVEASGGDEPGAERDGPAAAVPAPTTGPSWQRLILGTDEARERFDRQHPELFPAERDDRQGSGPSGGSGQSPATNQPTAPPGPSTSTRAERRLEAIDRAIALHDDTDEVAFERSRGREHLVAVPWRSRNAGPEWTAELTVAHRSRRPGTADVSAQQVRNSGEAPIVRDIERRIQFSASLALAACAMGAIGVRAADGRARSRTSPTALRGWPAPRRRRRDTRTEDD
jgi:hypothetical protein